MRDYLLTIQKVFSAGIIPVCGLFFFILFSTDAFAGEGFTQTPADYEGPFYPVVRQQDEDNDLIHVGGRPQSDSGEILKLSGVVVNTSGQPQKGITIEIWQTDSNGLYKDHRDRSAGQRDPNFQYWGKTITSQDGSFSFTTLLPGMYEPRPAHIHFKVWDNNKNILTSQLYFSNHPAEIKSMSNRPSTNELQTAELKKTDPGHFAAFFQIVL